MASLEAVDSVRCEICGRTWKLQPPGWHARCYNKECWGYNPILLSPGFPDQRYIRLSCPRNVQYALVWNTDVVKKCSCCKRVFVIENVVAERQNGQPVYSSIPLEDIIKAKEELKRKLMQQRENSHAQEKRLGEVTASLNAFEDLRAREKEEFEELRQQKMAFFDEKKMFIAESQIRLEQAEGKVAELEKALAEKTKEAEELKGEKAVSDRVKRIEVELLKSEMERKLQEERENSHALEKRLGEVAASLKASEDLRAREKEEFFESGLRQEQAEERAAELEKELTEKTREAEGFRREKEAQFEILKTEMDGLRKEKERGEISKTAAADRATLVAVLFLTEKALEDQRLKLQQAEEKSKEMERKCLQKNHLLEEYKTLFGLNERLKEKMEEELLGAKRVIEAQMKELEVAKREVEEMERTKERWIGAAEESLALVEKTETAVEELQERVDHRERQIAVLSATNRNLSDVLKQTVAPGSCLQENTQEYPKTRLLLHRDALETTNNETYLTNSQTFVHEDTIQSSSDQPQSNPLKRKLDNGEMLEKKPRIEGDEVQRTPRETYV